MAHGDREIEIKLAAGDAKSARRMLRSAGFRVSRRKVFETNVVCDTPGLALRKSGSLLRVRQAGNTVTLTYKGPATVSKHKSREELELEISDAGVLGAIFERLGFSPVFRYEKYRTEYRQRGGGIAALDETPIGVYVELEGTPQWIDRAARKLGFAEADYITASYAALYFDSCARRGVAASDMAFEPGGSTARRLPSSYASRGRR